MAEFDSSMILLALAWGGFFLIHSLLASLNIKRHILTKLPQFAPCYRLAYNLVAVITLIPVVLIHALHEAKLVYHWPGIFSIITTALAVLAFFAFIWSLKYYDLKTFTGITACSSKDVAATQDQLTISPMHRIVRHPWYLFALIIIWSRHQSSLDLISSILVTAYFFIGAKLEERKLVSEFGEAYQEYLKLVPGIIPLPWKFISATNAADIEQKSSKRPA